MEKSPEKRLEEKERVEAEIARSLSVVKMKETHKQIEDIEKARKRATIQSIIERINLAILKNTGFISGIDLSIKNNREKYKDRMALFEELLKSELTDSTIKSIFESVWENYESIIFDAQRNCEIKDFDKLFPKVRIGLKSIDSATTCLPLMNYQLNDLKVYCQRLL